ncbi:MAG: GFA family protein [Alphaproteobacteria bacterium]
MTEPHVAIDGHCLCGSVTVKAAKAATHMGACHCGMCRKWGGAPFLEVECGTDVSIDGAEHVTRYESSDWAERAFCNRCGTHLFYYLKPTGQHMVSIGLFQDEHEPEFTSQIFIDKKSPCYSFANQTETMTEAEVFARAAEQMKD